MKGIASLVLLAFMIGCTPPKKEEEKAYDFYVDLDAEIEKIQNSDLQFVKIAERAGLVDTVIMSPNWEDEFGLFKKADINSTRSSARYELETSNWGSKTTYRLSAVEELNGTQWVVHEYEGEVLTRVEYMYSEKDVLRQLDARLLYRPNYGLYQEVRTELQGSGIQKTKVSLRFISP